MLFPSWEQESVSLDQADFYNPRGLPVPSMSGSSLNWEASMIHGICRFFSPAVCISLS